MNLLLAIYEPKLCSVIHCNSQHKMCLAGLASNSSVWISLNNRSVTLLTLFFFRKKAFASEKFRVELRDFDVLGNENKHP